MFFSRHTLTRIFSALFALLIAVFLVPLASATSASAAEAETIHDLVNQARWDNGQAGLIRNPAMDTVALDWAKQMAANNSMSHNPNYSSQIPSGWRSAGENVAQGYRTAQSMHDGWMASPGHKANILGSYTDVGIAFYTSGGTTWGVQVFATYPGHTGPAQPAAAAPAPAPEEEPAPENETLTATAAPEEGETGADEKETSAGDSSSEAAVGTVDSSLPPALTKAELQASVYGSKPDFTWVAWAIFVAIAALGAGAWWFMVRRAPRNAPAGRRART